MKKNLKKTLKLRKDTLQTLGRDAMTQVAGGTSGHPICDEHTDNHVCWATTIAPTCQHNPSLGCPPTWGP